MDNFKVFFIVSHETNLDNILEYSLGENQGMTNFHKNLTKNMEGDEGKKYTTSVYSYDFIPKELNNDNKDKNLKKYKSLIKLTNKDSIYEGIILFTEKRNNFIYDFKFEENKSLPKDNAPPSSLELDKLEQMKIFLEYLNELNFSQRQNLSLDLNLDSQAVLKGKDNKFSFDFYLQIFNQCYKTKEIHPLLLMFKLERVILPKKLIVQDFSYALKDVEENPDIIGEKFKKIFYIILLYFKANYEKESVKNLLLNKELWKYYIETIPLNIQYFPNIEIPELLIKEIFRQEDLKYETIEAIIKYIPTNKEKLNIISTCCDYIKNFCKKNNKIIQIIDLAFPKITDNLVEINYAIATLVNYEALNNVFFLSFNNDYWIEYYKVCHNLDLINNIIRACQCMDKDLKTIKVLENNEIILEDRPITIEKEEEHKKGELIEKRLVMPTIGNVSVGKSYFLNSIFGIDYCQVKSGITTKFVLFIRHIDKLAEPKLYKIFPVQNNNTYDFYKEGEVITGEKNIQDKINKINEQIEKFDTPTFYMLEIEIKSIENKNFLNKVDFLDIPGLNESGIDYISLYFKFLKDLIKYCLIIFSVEKYNSQDSINVINKVRNNIYVPIENSLLILNKIDLIKNAKIEGALHDFKKVLLNENSFSIYRNKIVPLSSMKLKSEIQIGTNFYHFLNYYFLEYSNEYCESELSFLGYIELKIRSLNKEILQLLKNEIQDLKEDAFKDMKENVLNFVKEKQSKGYSININLKNGKDLKKIEFFYICFLKKYFILKISDSFKEINKYFNSIEDFSFPKLNTTESNIQKYIYDDTPGQMILNDLDNFFKETFNSKNLIKFGNIVPLLNDDFKVLNNYVHNSCLEYIPILGVSNSGKSSFINCLLQKDVLTCNSGECTRRGIIIRYIEEKDKISLYSIKFKSFENLGNKYYYYVKNQLLSDKIEEIKEIIDILNESFPKSEEDSFLLIEINIKCFDEINLKSEIKKNICIIDFPGHNTNHNLFFDKDIYQNVLKMSSFFIYINSGKAFKEESNKTLLSKLYNEVIKIRIGDISPEQFIDLSLFIFNKVDSLEENEKNLNGIQEEIKEVLGINNQFKGSISCSFFSSLLYHNFLLKKEDFKINNIRKLFDIFYLNFRQQYDGKDDLFDEREEYYGEFAKRALLNKIKSEFNEFPLSEQKKKEDIISSEIYNIIHTYMEDIYKENKLKKEENYEKNILDICKYLILYNENIAKINDYRNSYANQTLEEMSKKIIKSSELKKQEYINHLERFFYFMNIFFRIESTNFEITKAKEDFEKVAKDTLKNIENIFDEYQGQKIIEEFKENIFAFIEEKRKSYKQLIAEHGNKIDNVLSIVENEINERKKNFRNQFDSELKKIETKISEELKKIGFSEQKSVIDKNVEKIVSTKIKFFFATLGIGALAYGLFYSLPKHIIRFFRDKNKFDDFLDKIKENIENDLESISTSIDKNFKSFKKINMENAKRLLGLIEAGNIKTDDFWNEAKEKYLEIFNNYKAIKNI